MQKETLSRNVITTYRFLLLELPSGWRGIERMPDEDWLCPDCDIVLKAENVDSRSTAMKSLTVEQLSSLLKFSLNRLKAYCPEEFQKPVPLDEFPNYPEFVVHPMDLETVEIQIKKKSYGCTESFLADVKWIHHNCIVFNGYQHKLTNIAKNLVKMCKHEMNEIEVCPDCYYNASTKKENWFQEPCFPPHLLVWAKLKGFPFWPAKAMKIASGAVDVRFFGAHDRAWIPISQCFLLSSVSPASMKMKVKRKGVFEQSMDELSGHILKLKEYYNAFQYASPKASIQSEDLLPHIETMLPGVNVKEIRRSFMFDRMMQPRFYCPGKSTKSEVSGMFDEIQSNASHNDQSFPENSLFEISNKEKSHFDSKMDLERYMEKNAARRDFNFSEHVSESYDKISDSETEMKMDDSAIKIHLKRTDSSSSEVWETKTDSQESKHLGDKDSEQIAYREENEAKLSCDTIQDESVISQRSTLDVNLGDNLDSILDEDNADTVHVQLSKTTFNKSSDSISTAKEEDIIHDKMPTLENQSEVTFEDSNPTQDQVDDGANVLYSAEYSDEEASSSQAEGDLVIDLERDNRETKRPKKESSTLKKKSPFGGIKLKEKKSRSAQHSKPVVDARPNRQSMKKFTSKRPFPVPSNRMYTMLPKLNASPKAESVSFVSTNAMPKLKPRPSSLNASGDSYKSESGIMKYSRKVVDFMHGTLEEMFQDLSSSGNSDKANIATLQMEMERMRWWHCQEIAELKHNNDLVLLEMRNSMEYEKQRAIAEVISQCQLEKQRAIEETKRKQWCAFCGKEALYYCCWNTSYCDHSCQQAHWPQHTKNCIQHHSS
ncbi:Protein kinase C-binding protein 1 [Chamberlinius hualienensis]